MTDGPYFYDPELAHGMRGYPLVVGENEMVDV